MELAEVVAAAVRARTPELELLVREQVDAELARLVPEIVERELAARRNGDGQAEPSAATVEESAPPEPATKRCRACGEVKPLDAFPADKARPDGVRNECRECRNRRRRRERERQAKDEQPSEPRWRPGTGLGPRTAKSELSDREARRELLAALRANGVTTELRDGREYVVLHLPGVEREPGGASGPVRRHLAPRYAPTKVA